MEKRLLYFTILVLLTLMIVGITDSLSQKVSHKDKEQPTHSQHKQIGIYNPNQKNFPTPAIINDRHETRNSTTKKEEDRNPNNSSDFFYGLVSFFKNRWNDIFLTLFTFFVALFTYLLYKATAGLWGVAKDQSEDIKQSIAIAKETAEAVKIQAEIMRQELALKQRAKIQVRDIVIPHFEDLFEKSEFLKGQLSVVNVGGMAANIIHIGAWFEVGYGKRIPTERPEESEKPNVPNPKPDRLEAGQSFTYNFIDNRTPGSSYDSIRMGKSDCTLYAIGYIEYTDTTGVVKRTAFFREYRLPKDRIGGYKEERKFFPVEGYEYEE